MEQLSKHFNDLCNFLCSLEVAISDISYGEDLDQQFFDNPGSGSIIPSDHPVPGIYYYINSIWYRYYIGELNSVKDDFIDEIKYNLKFSPRLKDQHFYLQDVINKLYGFYELVNQEIIHNEAIYSHKNISIIDKTEVYHPSVKNKNNLISEICYEQKLFIGHLIQELEDRLESIAPSDDKTKPIGLKLKEEYIDIRMPTIMLIGLQNEKFLGKEVRIRQFRKLFLGLPILTPVKWRGNNSELKYFIQQLKKKEKIESPIGPLWETVSNCFLSEKGKKINSKSLEWADGPPAKSKILDKIVDNIDQDNLISS